MEEIKFEIKIRRKDGSDSYYEHLSLDSLINRDGLLFSSLFEVEYKRQFIGLKDKNGKDIYDGDICKRTKHVELYKIVFYKYAWALENETVRAVWYQEFCNGARAEELEVIGNFYENPELLLIHPPVQNTPMSIEEYQKTLLDRIPQPKSWE